MRNNKSVKIIFLSVILPFLFSSGYAFAYKESDYRKALDNVWRANLSGADLSSSILVVSNLSGANLHKANLSGTNLDKALAPPIRSESDNKKLKKEADIIVLQLVYYKYIMTKLCAELPRDFKYKGKDFRYINEPLLKIIKKGTKIFDNYIKSKYPDVDTDEIWLKANQSWNKGGSKASLKLGEYQPSKILQQVCDETSIFLDTISTGSSKSIDGRVRWAIKYEDIDNIPSIFEINDFKIDWNYKHVFKKWIEELNKSKKEGLVEKDF